MFHSLLKFYQSFAGYLCVSFAQYLPQNLTKKTAQRLIKMAKATVQLLSTNTL